MSWRNFELNVRVESSRDPHIISAPIQFELVDIKKHFEQSLDKIKNQYDIADSLLIDGKEDDCKNVWRAQIVFLEGILDFYIHEISKYCLYRMFTDEWEKSVKYQSLQIPIIVVEEGIAAAKSKEWFFNFLNDRFSRDVFLSAESMRNQLNLIGIGYGNVMHMAFQKKNTNESQKYGDEIVRKLFERRNAIVHQMDRDHGSAKQSDITKVYVAKRIEEVIAIVDAMHNLASQKG